MSSENWELYIVMDSAYDIPGHQTAPFTAFRKGAAIAPFPVRGVHPVHHAIQNSRRQLPAVDALWFGTGG